MINLEPLHWDTNVVLRKPFRRLRRVSVIVYPNSKIGRIDGVPRMEEAWFSFREKGTFLLGFLLGCRPTPACKTIYISLPQDHVSRKWAVGQHLTSRANNVADPTEDGADHADMKHRKRRNRISSFKITRWIVENKSETWNLAWIRTV